MSRLGGKMMWVSSWFPLPHRHTTVFVNTDRPQVSIGFHCDLPLLKLIRGMLLLVVELLELLVGVDFIPVGVNCIPILLLS